LVPRAEDGSGEESARADLIFWRNGQLEKILEK